MSDEILRILNTYDDEVAKALTLKHGCQPAWADAKSKAVKSLSTLLSQETAELKEELRVGNALTAKFCDRCIDLEHQLAQKDKEWSEWIREQGRDKTYSLLYYTIFESSLEARLKVE